MSILLLVLLTLGYVHALEGKEQLSLTDFLLDFLLSLWVPPNYAPSKFTRSIPDPSAKEQMISIEKSKVALDNYIKHLLRYARENNNNNERSIAPEGQASTIVNSNVPGYRCADPYHSHYYPTYGPPDTVDNQGSIDAMNGYPNQIYDGKGQSMSGIPMYEASGISDMSNGIPGVNMCLTSGSLPQLSPVSSVQTGPAHYQYGCPTKRNIRWDDGSRGQYLPYPDVPDGGRFKSPKRIWYLNRDSRKNKNILNKFYGSKSRPMALPEDAADMAPSIASRQVGYTDHIMSGQDNIRKRIASPNKSNKDVEARIYEQFYLPSLLDEMGNRPQSQQFAYPVNNQPYNQQPKYYSNNYKRADVTDAMVANRMLDTKLASKGGLLNAMARLDSHEPATVQTEEPEKKLEKKSQNNADLPTPPHRFGELQSSANKSDKDFAEGHALKPEDKAH